MSKAMLAWCALGVILLGCSADVDADQPSAELVTEQRAALIGAEPGAGVTAPGTARKPICTPTCTISLAFESACSGRGGYSMCEDTTAMCCKDTKDINGNVISTLCAANPNEVRPAPPAPTVSPVDPALGPLK